MADLKVCDYLINSANNPHIKFAMLDGLNISEAEENLEKISKEHNKISVQFKSYSFYPGDTPFVCIDIAVSYAILELQSRIQNTYKELGNGDNRGYFDAGIWKPDCQLTISFSKSKLANAVEYLCETKLPLNGTLERLGIIEYHPAKQLCSCMLV